MVCKPDWANISNATRAVEWYFSRVDVYCINWREALNIYECLKGRTHFLTAKKFRGRKRA